MTLAACVFRRLVTAVALGALYCTEVRVVGVRSDGGGFHSQLFLIAVTCETRG